MASAPTIGAIETEYAGVRFRSRTEARWAVFFDALGLKWEHEPEAYTDGRTWYTPDFWLPELDCFWEVKGTRDYDVAKVEMLCEVTGKELVVSYLHPSEAAVEGAGLGGLWVDVWHYEQTDGELKKVPGMPAVDLMSFPDQVAGAAAVANRARFWDPGSAGLRRVDPIAQFERCRISEDSPNDEFNAEDQQYRTEWDWFCRSDDPELIPPGIPSYPADPRVVSGNYDERHDNLARKWFYEIGPQRRKQIKKALACKGTIVVEFYPWAMNQADYGWGTCWLGPDWFEQDSQWDTGEGDLFSLMAANR